MSGPHPKSLDFVLKYKFTLDGKAYSVENRMVFRNRICDDQGNGVKINKWEGFSRVMSKS